MTTTWSALWWRVSLLARMEMRRIRGAWILWRRHHRKSRPKRIVNHSGGMLLPLGIEAAWRQYAIQNQARFASANKFYDCYVVQNAQYSLQMQAQMQNAQQGPGPSYDGQLGRRDDYSNAPAGLPGGLFGGLLGGATSGTIRKP